MIRWTFVALLAAILATACRPAPAPTQQGAARKRPNIVFLISDDHSAFDVGAYGNTAVRTPVIDRLAREGMRFTNAFVTSPQCSPSRASILTGRSPVAIGASRLHSPVRDRIPSIVESLKRAGYWVAATRKVHLGDAFQRRWDYYGGFDNAPSEPLAHRPKDKPFFLWVGFDDPHRPYPHGGAPVVPPTNPAAVIVPPWLPDTPAVRADLAQYYDGISRMDTDAGDVIAALEREGLDKDTIVVFTADNGMPFPGAKGSLWDPGIHVPLVVKWPGHVAPAGVDKDLVSLVDLPATWLDVAGAEPIPEIEGRSIAVRLTGAKPGPTRDAVFAERDWHDTQDCIRVVRTDRFALIANQRAELPYLPTLDLEESPTWKSILEQHKAKTLPAVLETKLFAAPRPALELYDLSADPQQTKNLATDPSFIAERDRHAKLLGSWQTWVNDYAVPVVRGTQGKHGERGYDDAP